MIEQLSVKAQRLFNSKLVSEETNENNQRKWVASMIVLGNKSILVKKIQRKIK